MFNNILLVCVGNVCRSPTAEYLFKQKLADKTGLVIHSCGLGALVDKPIDATAGALLLENGIDPSAHTARQVRSEILVSADLILAMEPGHLKSISDIAPQVSGKSFLLGKWSNNEKVPDPYKKSREAYEHVYKLIDKYTDDWLKYL